MTSFNEERIKSYIDYVSHMIDKYKLMGDLVDEADDTITPEKLNTVLSYYYNVSLALNAEYQRAKIQHLAEKQEFETWQDEIFEKAKSSVLNEYEDTKIKPSLKEFETRARNDNRVEYNQREMRVLEAEAKMRFLLRLQDTLSGYESILVTISQNMRQEMRTLGIDSKMRDNKIREGIGIPKPKSRIPVSIDD